MSKKKTLENLFGEALDFQKVAVNFNRNVNGEPRLEAVIIGDHTADILARFPSKTDVIPAEDEGKYAVTFECGTPFIELVSGNTLDETIAYTTVVLGFRSMQITGMVSADVGQADASQSATASPDEAELQSLRDQVAALKAEQEGNTTTTSALNEQINTLSRQNTDLQNQVEAYKNKSADEAKAAKDADDVAKAQAAEDAAKTGSESNTEANEPNTARKVTTTTTSTRASRNNR